MSPVICRSWKRLIMTTERGSGHGGNAKKGEQEPDRKGLSLLPAPALLALQQHHLLVQDRLRSRWKGPLTQGQARVLRCPRVAQGLLAHPYSQESGGEQAQPRTDGVRANLPRQPAHQSPWLSDGMWSHTLGGGSTLQSSRHGWICSKPEQKQHKRLFITVMVT